MMSAIHMIPLEARGGSVHHGMRGQSGNQTHFEIVIYKDAFVNEGLADGQTFGVSYTEESTSEDPIVHIRGNSLSGPFDEIVHIHDIDPRNASYAELSALVGHLGKTGELDTNGGWLSGLPCDVPKGDIHQKKDYTKVLQDYMNGRGKYNLPMTMQAQTLLSAYQKQINQLDAKHGAVSKSGDLALSDSEAIGLSGSQWEYMLKSQVEQIQKMSKLGQLPKINSFEFDLNDGYKTTSDLLLERMNRLLLQM